MIIFGKDERSKLEEIRNELSSDVLETYDISRWKMGYV